MANNDECRPLVVNQELSGDATEHGKEGNITVTIQPAPLHCGGRFIVEPLLILFSVALRPMHPASSQLTYALVADSLGPNYTNLSTNNGHVVPCVPPSNNTTINDLDRRRDYIQAQVTQFDTYRYLVAVPPLILTTMFYGAYSDRHGRKLLMLLPCVTCILTAFVYLAVMYFRLPVYFLFVKNAFELFFGTEHLVKLAAFAYIADTEPLSDRGFRMAILDVLLIVLDALADLGIGYLIDGAGFYWPFVYVIGAQLLSFTCTLLFMPQSIPHQNPEEHKSNPCKDLVQSFKVYTRTGPVKGRRWKLLLLSGSLLVVRLFSSAHIQGLMVMNAPFCWDSVTIGYNSLISTGVRAVGTLFGTKFFPYCLRPGMIVVFSMGIGIFGNIYMVFVTTTLMMFFASSFGLFSMLHTPIVSAIMSGLVESREQGALLAMLSIAEYFAGTASKAIINPIYTATLAWMPSFVFLVSGMACVVSLSFIIMFVFFSGRERQHQTS